MIDLSAFVNVKDAPFNAVGDLSTDDTAAIQTAIDFCFGPASAPHGGNDGVYQNKTLFIPPGHYKVSGVGLKLTSVHGGRIIGAGRMSTCIENPSGSVFTTNGMQYSHVEGLRIVANGVNSRGFNLDYDGAMTNGVALQSNSFSDMFFDGGEFGVLLGWSGHMGSENLFTNCYFIRQTIAGLCTYNYNALQQTVIGGNFQTCHRAIWIKAGSVPIIHGVGFQESADWDIYGEQNARDSYSIMGCRTESVNFARFGGHHLNVAACSQLNGTHGVFVESGGIATLTSCVSENGFVRAGGPAVVAVNESNFGRDDWYTVGNGSIEARQVRHGSVIKTGGTLIQSQRIVPAGYFDYQVAQIPGTPIVA